MIDWQPGKLLKNGKYSLTRELGQGGFGITYLAKNQDGQPVVIKTLNTTTIHQQSLNFDKFKEDFYQEALRLAKCSHHAHIVNIVDLIPDVEGLPCIVMEYVSGQNLFDLVQKQGILSPEIALGYIEQIGSALQSVHEKNIIHRDIKPHNILIRDNQKDAVLIDFGIAREFDPKKVGAHLTSFVSEGYTPIEQIASSSNSSYTDVYGLAATLYFILTGETPVDARNRALFASQEKDPLIPPQSLNPKIDNKLSQAILEGMEIYPEKRPQTISTWLNLLRETSPKLSYSTTIQSVPLSSDSNLVQQTHSTLPISKNQSISKKRKGLSLSILVSLITISSIGIYSIFGKNLPDNLAKYSGQGLSLEYPSQWTLSAYEPNTFNPVFAQLLAPNNGDNKVFPSKVVLEIIHLSQPSSLEEITEQTIQEINQFLPNATLIENQKITLAGSEAYQLIYTGEEEQELIKRKQIGILDKNKLYVMTYEAKIDQYSQHEKLADKIMNSVQLLP